jgi:phosphatidylserine/phosphatidylglycerophosphate/cardiolipin synthase-like enzyme
VAKPLEGAVSLADPTTWFLQFANAGGDGLPWGDGTAVAARNGQGLEPWDANCSVKPIIGGYAAMVEIRTVLEQAISDAQATGKNPGDADLGHVYIAGWRLNAQRDLSDNVVRWPPAQPTVPADQTALGLIFRLLQAGVRVRVLVWLPTWIETPGAGHAHVEDHYFSAEAIAAEVTRLEGQFPALAAGDPLGVMALDARTAEGSVAGTHHQKMMVISGLNGNDVAFVGGVDLGFTRRDAPASDGTGNAATAADGWNAGDWQSGDGIPQWKGNPGVWPPQAHGVEYSALNGVSLPEHPPQDSDLPKTDKDTGKDIYGSLNQIWHDQHLELRGPIVQTLESQFAERWSDSAPDKLFDLSSKGNTFGGQVIFSSSRAIKNGDIVSLPLPTAAASPAGANVSVQMLRTIPWRDARSRQPFTRGEFTAMSGISHAMSQTQNLIWIFDQYFWSVPLARQINAHLQAATGVHVIVLLPPYADTKPSIIHQARKSALDALVAGSVGSRIAVYDLWDPRGNGRGVYCHAKVQIYDGSLMICGSANLNRRSFLCDSEIACGVLDETTVLNHQRALWKLLFHAVPSPRGDWPGVDLNQPGTGATFFQKFTAAAQDPAAGIHQDPWQSSTPTLANGVELPRWNPLAGAAIDHIFDPTSLDPRFLERKVDYRDAQNALQSRPAQLDDVVKRLDKTSTLLGKTFMPNRRQSSELRLPLSEKHDLEDYGL